MSLNTHRPPDRRTSPERALAFVFSHHRASSTIREDMSLLHLELRCLRIHLQKVEPASATYIAIRAKILAAQSRLDRLIEHQTAARSVEEGLIHAYAQSLGLHDEPDLSLGSLTLGVQRGSRGGG